MGDAPLLSTPESTYFQKRLDVEYGEDLVANSIALKSDRMIVDIPLSAIDVRSQVRKTIDQEQIERLAADIEQKGLIHPVTVMGHPEDATRFILIIGETRLKAFQHLGRDRIPSVVKPYTNSDVDIKLIQLAENMHRTDIHPVELADALMDIKIKSGLTLEKIAVSVGRTIDSLKQYSRIYKLSDEQKQKYLKNKTPKNDILRQMSRYNTLQKGTQISFPWAMDMVKTQKDKLELKKLTVWKTGKRKDSKQAIETKIAAAEKFIEEAKARLSELS